DLLDLDKIEAGKLALEPRVLSVAQVMERAIGKVISSADNSGVIIRAGETGAEIYADPDRIVQALANLLSNAVKMSPRNSRVDVSVVQDDGWVEVRATSSGASISANQLGTLFDRYQHTEAGLSLELPLSMEIIKLHGGAMGATSEQPQGCTFWFRLLA